MPSASLTTRDAVSGRNPPVPCGLRRREATCGVGAPRLIFGYACGAPPCIPRSTARCFFCNGLLECRGRQR